MKATKFFALTLLTFAFFATSCDKSNEPDQSALLTKSLISVSSEGITTYELENICPVLDVTSPLTADEIEFLYAMREDEKLAKDLYTGFAALFSANQQFSRIANAEANHIAAIERILSYYEIDFPSLGESGVFADAALQARFDELKAAATTALEAFKVMALIEESNVYDYNSVMLNASNVNIKILLENMIKSSSNHLKASVRWITALGNTYMPSLLSQETFENIIHSNFSNGNKYGQKNGRGNGNHDTNSQKGGQGQGHKGSINNSGTCTNTSNGTSPGTGGSQGNIGRGYRGGR